MAIVLEALRGQKSVAEICREHQGSLLKEAIKGRLKGAGQSHDLEGRQVTSLSLTESGVEVQSVGTTGTYYIYSFDGKLLAEYNGLGECMRDYIYLGDRLLAEYQPQSGVMYYYTLDHINSVRVVTDQNGNRVYAAAYDPYGGIQKVWESSYSPGLKFSGKERDGESGLDYFGARYYANFHYRWLSPDPVIDKEAALTNPQLWNLYSFCRNNPVTYWDPDGMEVIYQTAELKSFFASLAARSRMVKATLALYEGPIRPNLIIKHDDAGFDISGEKAWGSFTADIHPDYGENLSKITADLALDQIEDLAIWSVKEAVLIIDKSLKIDISNKDTIGAALHELGHADEAIRYPLQYRRDIRKIRDETGRIIQHRKRPAEVYANSYEERAGREIWK